MPLAESKTVTINIDRRLHEQIVAIAVERRITVREAVNEFLRLVQVGEINPFGVASAKSTQRS